MDFIRKISAAQGMGMVVKAINEILGRLRALEAAAGPQLEAAQAELDAKVEDTKTTIEQVLADAKARYEAVLANVAPAAEVVEDVVDSVLGHDELAEPEGEDSE